MNEQHKELAAGRWKELTFVEQMANIGSEVSRALNWRNKGNSEYSHRALERALELLAFTIDCNTMASHYKELTRLKEALLDFFYGDNEFSSSENSWRKYFDAFGMASRRGRL